MYIYIYANKEFSINGNRLFFQKDVHRFTDHFASPVMYVRVFFEGEPSIYFLLNIG